ERPLGSSLCPYTTLFRSAAFAAPASWASCHSLGSGRTLVDGHCEPAPRRRSTGDLRERPRRGCADVRGTRVPFRASGSVRGAPLDRKSTRLNSSHVALSY